MNLQPPQKASNKRTGKRISFFNEQQGGGTPVPSKEPQVKDQQFYATGTRLPTSQASDFTKSDGFNTLAHNNMLNAVVYTQERPDAMRLNQQQVPGKWNMPDRNDAAWQLQPAGMWSRNATGYGASVVNAFYNPQEQIKRNQDKTVGVTQMEMYEGALQQMRSERTQLEQHAFARQQTHLNSLLQAQQQQQLQQQHLQQQQQLQHQSQHLSLQSFQMAFGHQGQKPVLSELFHAFPNTAANAAYAAQQKPTALPQLQLFENFYPSAQQQQVAYGMQQAMAQSHAAAAQQKMHSLGQHVPPSEEYLKAVAEQNQQCVPPKTQIPLPRRSRRLSKEGPPPAPGVPQVNNLYPHPSYEHAMQHQAETHECYKKGLQQQVQRDSQIPKQESQYVNPPEQNNAPLPQNGRAKEMQADAEQITMGHIQPMGMGAVTGGVIQSTRRRRRISQEANLFTLAQKAAEMPSLENTKDGDIGDKKKNTTFKSSEELPESLSNKRARADSYMKPLVIPVSVPVKMDSVREKGEDERTQGSAASERDVTVSKPSVIVTRHRVGQTNPPEPAVHGNESSPASEGETSTKKPRQRPRPEPLFIPPKTGTFIVPVMYSNITPYQSHLRSPVRISDHPGDRNFELPPYTPPPILSPVREGSGLYFNAIISASSNAMPPPITPKSSTRTLLRSTSVDDMPPVLTAMGEATPVSIEPRINIGSRFQADIPELRSRSLAAGDKYKADLVWWPWEQSVETQGKVDELLTAACSSILPGGGTNQELALHYLHESRGDILAALAKLLLKKPQRNRNHPLTKYHYSGSDRWSASERRLFNKGMAIYKKDFLLVQKLIKTKTVAQCVEFYYTYKKQVKIGRNGMLIFGDVEASTDEKNPREDSEVDVKSSQRLAPVVPFTRETVKEEETQAPGADAHAEHTQVQIKMEENEEDDKRVSFPLKITQTLEASEIANDTLVLRAQEPDARIAEAAPKPRGRRPRNKLPPDGAKKDVGNKPPEQEGSFPCKKCGRVFTKVKSRSAHMKSHAEQEKKAAALRQSELAAAQAQAALHARSQHIKASYSRSSSSDSCDSTSSSESCDSSDDGEI